MGYGNMYGGYAGFGSSYGGYGMGMNQRNFNESPDFLDRCFFIVER